MTRGRRPAGICGAALLLAARMNNFRRSVEEIVQVVKIADTTLKKRLDEFKNTPSGSLTLADFRSVWLDEEMDPPAFTKGKEKEEAERLVAEAVARGETEEPEGATTVKGKGKAKAKAQKKGAKRKGKRKRVDSDDEDPEEAGLELESGQKSDVDTGPPPLDIRDSILASALGPESEPLFLPDDDPDANIDPALREPSQPVFATNDGAPSPSPPFAALPDPTTDESALSAVVAEEVSTFLQNSQGAQLSQALDEAEQRRLAQITVVDELLGLDERELDRFILSEEEVKIKERVWVELNKDYLEAIAGQ